MKYALQIGVGFALAATMATPASAVELIVNGGFEASTSTTSTPTGWSNVGHIEGVIAYSAVGMPAYQGSYFYDLGGFGNASGPVGDGIQQTVATIIGQLYTLTFGLSSENRSGTSVLNVLFNGVLGQAYTLGTNGLSDFRKPFATQTLSYFANSSSTTISFIEAANSSGGNNDPLIDGVSFQGAAATGVPEPTTWAMMLFGFGSLGYVMRRKQVSARIRFA